MLFILSRILWRTGFSKIFTIKCKLYKLKFFPTSVLAEKWVYPDFGREDEEFLTLFLRSGDTVIDVGANVGTLTLTAATVVGSSGKVFSIEAHPVIFKYLQGNIKINNLKNVFLFNTAIGDKNGFIQFSNKLLDDLNEVVTSKGIQINVKKLDDLLLDKVEKVELLKVDVEGYEKFVFQGAVEILKKIECIYFESWENLFIKYNYTSLDVLDILRASGFNIYQIKKGEVRQVPLNYISETFENLLAIRNIQLFRERTGWLERETL